MLPFSTLIIVLQPWFLLQSSKSLILALIYPIFDVSVDSVLHWRLHQVFSELTEFIDTPMFADVNNIQCSVHIA